MATTAYQKPLDPERRLLWCIIHQDERLLRQLASRQPPKPGTVLHSLEQLNLREESLERARCNERRQAKEVRSRKNALDEWHAEWTESERYKMEPAHGFGLLTEPANIDLQSHQRRQGTIPLDYYGTNEEAPPGTRAQRTASAVKRAHAATSARNTTMQLEQNMQPVARAAPRHIPSTQVRLDPRWISRKPLQHLPENIRQVPRLAHEHPSYRY